MSELLASDKVWVAVKHESDGVDDRLVARFFWADGKPEETYRIKVSDNVEIDMDMHLPVRPSAVYIQRPGADGEELAPYAGEELSGRLTGPLSMYAINMSLSSDTRFRIARMQVEAKNTPELLREACSAMLSEHYGLPTAA
jgi:hypothetical protein